jgi:hypothetical protein
MHAMSYVMSLKSENKADQWHSATAQSVLRIKSGGHASVWTNKLSHTKEPLALIHLHTFIIYINQSDIPLLLLVKL